MNRITRKRIKKYSRFSNAVSSAEYATLRESLKVRRIMNEYLVLEEEGNWWACLKATDLDDLASQLTSDYMGALGEDATVFIIQANLDNRAYVIRTEQKYVLEGVNYGDSQSES